VAWHMAKNRIALAIWLFAVVFLHIFGNNYGTMVILIASAAIPVLFVIFAGIAARRTKAGLAGSGFLPGYMNYHVLCENLFTGEKCEERLKISTDDSIETKFSVSSHNCGMLSTSITLLAVTDIFGLYAWKVNHTAHNNELVMPKLLDIQLEVNPNKTPADDSEEYSMQRPGNDPSETFAIREYVPGDLLKSIHWKLSHKTDRLLVRELGLPIENKILLLLETTVSAEPDSISRAASNLYSVSRELIEREMPHAIGWLDTKTEIYVNREVVSHDDINAAFAELLANTVKECAVTTMEAYDAASTEYVYSVVVVIDNAEIGLLEI